MATRAVTPTETCEATCLASNLGWLLGQASAVLQRELAIALEPLDLGQRGFCVLGTAIDGEYTQIELAKEIGMDKTTMVVTLDQLEADGLVERKPLATDRRVRVVAVTRAGKRRYEKAETIVSEVQRDVLARLPEGQRAALMSSLNKIVSD